MAETMEGRVEFTDRFNREWLAAPLGYCFPREVYAAFLKEVLPKNLQHQHSKKHIEHELRISLV